MKALSVIGLLFGSAIIATVPISPQVTPQGIELRDRSSSSSGYLWAVRAGWRDGPTAMIGGQDTQPRPRWRAPAMGLVIVE